MKKVLKTPQQKKKKKKKKRKKNKNKESKNIENINEIKNDNINQNNKNNINENINELKENNILKNQIKNNNNEMLLMQKNMEENKAKYEKEINGLKKIINERNSWDDSDKKMNKKEKLKKEYSEIKFKYDELVHKQESYKKENEKQLEQINSYECQIKELNNQIEISTKNYRVIKHFDDNSEGSKKYMSNTFNKGVVANSHSANKFNLKKGKILINKINKN